MLEDYVLVKDEAPRLVGPCDLKELSVACIRGDDDERERFIDSREEELAARYGRTTATRVGFVLRELIENYQFHGNDGDPDKEVSVRSWIVEGKDGRLLHYQIASPHAQFDPSCIRVPSSEPFMGVQRTAGSAIAGNLHAEGNGGFGSIIVYRSVDTLLYDASGTCAWAIFAVR